MTTYQSSRTLCHPRQEGIRQPLQGQFAVPSQDLGFPGPLSDIGNIMADVLPDLNGNNNCLAIFLLLVQLIQIDLHAA